jgi:uncharacterized protein
MIRNLLQRHQLSGFFIFAFSISWCGILVILVGNGFDLSPMQPLESGLIFLAMIMGPTISGLMLIALLEGHVGLKLLGSRALRWQAPLRWYAVALLTVPAILLLLMLVFVTFVDPAFAPRFQWPLLMVGLFAGCFEEIGWSGFATPRFLAQKSVGFAGLLLGLVWAFWHLLVDFRYNFNAMGFKWPLEFAIVYIATLTPYRMLMMWVYSHTQSLWLAILMHASFTGWLLVLFPLTSPLQSLLLQSAFAFALFCLVLVVFRKDAIRFGKKLFSIQDGT